MSYTNTSIIGGFFLQIMEKYRPTVQPKDTNTHTEEKVVTVNQQLKTLFPQEAGEHPDAFNGRITAYRSIVRETNDYQAVYDLRSGQESRLLARQNGTMPENTMPEHSLYGDLIGADRDAAHMERFDAWQARTLAAGKPLSGKGNHE